MLPPRSFAITFAELAYGIQDGESPPALRAERTALTAQRCLWATEMYGWLKSESE